MKTLQQYKVYDFNICTALLRLNVQYLVFIFAAKVTRCSKAWFIKTAATDQQTRTNFSDTTNFDEINPAELEKIS